MIKRFSTIFLLYLLLAILFTWPLVIGTNNYVVNSGDPLFYAWNLMHNTRSLTKDFTNILNTNIYYPTTNTLSLSDTLAAQTLFAAPIIWLTNNPILALNLYTLLTFPLAGFGMYILVRSFVNREWASVLSGLLFAFSYPRFGQLSHMPALSSQWLPYYFFGLYWFLIKGKFRYLVLLLISFLLLLGSSVYLGVFAIVVSLVIFGIFLISWVKNRLIITAWSRFKTMLLPTGFTVLISLILLFPYIRLKAEHPEITRTLSESSARAAYQSDFYSVTNTSILSQFLKTNEGERTLYPTVALLLLAGLGLSQWKKKAYRFSIIVSLIVALTGLVLSFGPERPFSIGSFDTGYITLPYAFLYKIFPLLQILRVPARFSIVFILGLSVLAGYGAMYLASRKKWVPVLAGITLLFLFEIWQHPLSLVDVRSYADAPPVYKWLQQQSNIRAIIELPIGNIEEGSIPIAQQVSLRYEDVTSDSPLATETYRVYFAGFHNKKTMNGYSGYVAQSYHDAVNNMALFPNTSSINYLRSQGISHVIVHLWQINQNKRNRYIITPDHVDLTTKFVTHDGDIVYEIRPH